MTLSPDFVQMLRCPETRSPLHIADASVVERLNEQIARGTLANRGGRRLETPLDGGLLRDDQSVLYPIIHGIPILLVDDGIELDRGTSTTP